jgi:hypothetical protein
MKRAASAAPFSVSSILDERELNLGGRGVECPAATAK